MRFAALRRPQAAARLARALWFAWALVVWNVVFDHVIVVGGRNYIAAATRAASAPAASVRYENMDAWMRPTMTHAFRVAGITAAVILIAGVVMTRAARRRTPQVGSCA